MTVAPPPLSGPNTGAINKAGNAATRHAPEVWAVLPPHLGALERQVSKGQRLGGRPGAGAAVDDAHELQGVGARPLHRRHHARALLPRQQLQQHHPCQAQAAA